MSERKPFDIGDAIALSSPSGHMSQRARKAALRRLARDLFADMGEKMSIDTIKGEVRKEQHPTMDRYQTGDLVIARFTNSGRIHEFIGRVLGRTKNYWKVESVTAPYADQGEAPGRVFHIATLEARTYSANNSIRRLVGAPLSGFGALVTDDPL